jgi:LssY C-terminus
VRLLKRLLRRAAVLGLGILTVWLIAFIFRFTDSRLPTVLALAITYGVAAYIVLPRIVRMSLKILQRKRVPRFTITGDGLPGDPVKLVLNLGKASFWLNEDRPPKAECVHWIGAGTKDTGISLTRLTFQITHATDSDTNVERDYIIDELRRTGVIGEINSYKAGQRLGSKHVNHYVTDGEVTAASLLVNV